MTVEVDLPVRGVGQRTCEAAALGVAQPQARTFPLEDGPRGILVEIDRHSRHGARFRPKQGEGDQEGMDQYQW